MLWLLKSMAKGQMPCAMGLQQNIDKNLRKTMICHGLAVITDVFRHFSVLGALWSTSGRTLATSRRSVSALGSSLAAVGEHLAPNGSSRDP